MSLSKVLSKKAEGLDNGLDAIFQSSAGPSTSLLSASSKAEAPKESSNSKKKRRNSEEHESTKKKVRVDSDTTKKDSRSEKEKNAKGAKTRKDSSNASAENASEEVADGDNAEVLAAHDDDGSESDSSQVPLHESLTKKEKKRSKKVKKFVPDAETKEQRDARTVFVGNLPAEIVKNRSLSKKLKRHITELVPQSNVESIRFRSVPFQNPTSKLDVDEKKPPAKNEDVSGRDQRDQKRAAEWRDKQKTKGTDEDEVKEDEKKYMTPGQKRRLAFIKGELHDSAARVNAYVVFAHPIPSDLRPSNVPHKDVMDPFEAAKTAVLTCNGTAFEGHTIHVDYVGKRTRQPTADEPDMVQADPKRSIFVGNLDFAAAEEDLRAFFEATMCTERGSAPEVNDESSELSKTWVENVRIVRDRETQLGKGFAYVQFLDRECVDEILSLEAIKLKFAKRTLRVQRCKTLPGSQVKVTSGKPIPNASKLERAKGRHPEPRAAIVPVVIAKGDPKLGEKLAGLSKEMRKEAKSKDADRVARRIAKKKARNALEKSGVKVSNDLKLRTRERKKGGLKVNTGRKTRKPRVRSDRAATLRNGKKQ